MRRSLRNEYHQSTYAIYWRRPSSDLQHDFRCKRRNRRRQNKDDHDDCAPARAPSFRALCGGLMAAAQRRRRLSATLFGRFDRALKRLSLYTPTAAPGEIRPYASDAARAGHFPACSCFVDNSCLYFASIRKYMPNNIFLLLKRYATGSHNTRVNHGSLILA